MFTVLTVLNATPKHRVNATQILKQVSKNTVVNIFRNSELEIKPSPLTSILRNDLSKSSSVVAGSLRQMSQKSSNVSTSIVTTNAIIMTASNITITGLMKTVTITKNLHFNLRSAASIIDLTILQKPGESVDACICSHIPPPTKLVINEVPTARLKLDGT